MTEQNHIQGDVEIEEPPEDDDEEFFLSESEDPRTLPNYEILPRTFKSKLQSGLTPFETLQELLDFEFFEYLALKRNKYAQDYLEASKAKKNTWREKI